MSSIEDEGPDQQHPGHSQMRILLRRDDGQARKGLPQEGAADIPHLSVTENNSQNLVQGHLESRLRLALAADVLVMREIGQVGVMRNVIPTYL